MIKPIAFTSKIPISNGFKVICDCCKKSAKDVPNLREQKFLKRWYGKGIYDFCSIKCLKEFKKGVK